MADFIQALATDLRPVKLAYPKRNAAKWIVGGIFIHILILLRAYPAFLLQSSVVSIFLLEIFWSLSIWFLFTGSTSTKGKIAPPIFVALSLSSFLWMPPLSGPAISLTVFFCASLIMATLWNLALSQSLARVLAYDFILISAFSSLTSFVFAHTAMSLWFFHKPEASISFTIYGLYFMILFPMSTLFLQRKHWLHILSQTRFFDSIKKNIFPYRLLEGSSAPSMQITAAATKTAELISQGQKIWLIFYRYGQCPLCLFHLLEIEKKAEAFAKKGLKTVLVFESAPEDLESLRKRFALYPSITFVSDRERKFYDRYGVEKNWGAIFHPSVLVTMLKAAQRGIFQGRITGFLHRVPAHFLINEKGMIHRAYYGETIADQMPWADVDSFLANSQ